MARSTATLKPLLRRAGWPKATRCLGCNRLRTSEGPGERLCPTCRERASAIDTGPAPVVRGG